MCQVWGQQGRRVSSGGCVAVVGTIESQYSMMQYYVTLNRCDLDRSHEATVREIAVLTRDSGQGKLSLNHKHKSNKDFKPDDDFKTFVDFDTIVDFDTLLHENT